MKKTTLLLYTHGGNQVKWSRFDSWPGKHLQSYQEYKNPKKLPLWFAGDGLVSNALRTISNSTTFALQNPQHLWDLWNSQTSLTGRLNRCEPCYLDWCLLLIWTHSAHHKMVQPKAQILSFYCALFYLNDIYLGLSPKIQDLILLILLYSNRKALKKLTDLKDF